MRKLLWKLLLGMLIVLLNDFMYDSFFTVSLSYLFQWELFILQLNLLLPLIVLFVMTFHLKLFRILTINAESNQLLSGILFTE